MYYLDHCHGNRTNLIQISFSPYQKGKSNHVAISQVKRARFSFRVFRCTWYYLHVEVEKAKQRKSLLLDQPPLTQFGEGLQVSLRFFQLLVNWRKMTALITPGCERSVWGMFIGMIISAALGDKYEPDYWVVANLWNCWMKFQPLKLNEWREEINI